MNLLDTQCKTLTYSFVYFPLYYLDLQMKLLLYSSILPVYKHLHHRRKDSDCAIRTVHQNLLLHFYELFLPDAVPI